MAVVEIRGFVTFPKGISLKVSVLAWLEFELSNRIVAA